MPAKIAVIYSSTWGHIRTLAETVAKAAEASGAEVKIFQFPEILTEDVLAKMHAAPKGDYPIISANDLTEFDGFLFGIPTRYGRAVGAASAFFDTTGGLWAKGALVGKFAGIFTSSASQHGGQETTALTTIPFLAHHGISFVPIGFAAAQLTDNSEIVGGSAYGAASIANGDGSRGLTEKELAIATYQGTFFSGIVNTFVAGKAATA
ncbi:NAD(P)H:quinone oxidoreductase, type IV [Meredithblackwellia eburnea MCA 4105]